jgi:antitoxin (DNA-binding transcriptional repressor) of toxin-antitoxin stability system
MLTSAAAASTLIQRRHRMPERVTIAQLSEHLADLLTRVREKGESFSIEREGSVIATLAPAGDGAKANSWREFVERYRELPRPDDEFADDLDAIHSAQGPAKPPSWPS